MREQMVRYTWEIVSSLFKLLLVLNILEEYATHDVWKVQTNLVTNWKKSETLLPF